MAVWLLNFGFYWRQHLLPREHNGEDERGERHNQHRLRQSARHVVSRTGKLHGGGPHQRAAVEGGAMRMTPTPFSMARAVPNGFESRCTFARISCATAGAGTIGIPIFESGR